MAHLNGIPDQKSILIFIPVNGIETTQNYKLSPKNPDGTVKDMTGFNVATMFYDLNTASANEQPPGFSETLTVVTADATGITVIIPQGDLRQVWDNIRCSTSCPMSIKVGDGTNDLLANVGNLAFNVSP